MNYLSHGPSSKEAFLRPNIAALGTASCVYRHKYLYLILASIDFVLATVSSLLGKLSPESFKRYAVKKFLLLEPWAEDITKSG